MAKNQKRRKMASFGVLVGATFISLNLVLLSTSASELDLHTNGVILDSLPHVSSNDALLGDDWLAVDEDDGGDDGNSTGGHSRPKRAVGTSLDDSMINMTLVASESLGADQADLGDSWTFDVKIDFPAIALPDATDVKIELFGVDPDYGVFGFHICQAHKEALGGTAGTQIRAVQDYPVYTDTAYSGYSTVVKKTSLLFEKVHTDGKDASDDKNVLQIQFQAVLVNPESTTNWLKNGKDYYITAGVEYADGSYIWAGQAKISTVLVEKEYDASVSLFLTSEHSNIPKGDSRLFRMEMSLTTPMADLELGIMQPLGYNDIFHIGEIDIELGNAFACTGLEKLKAKYNRSPSGMSVNNATLTFGGLINRDATRDVSQDMNKIDFKIPIHVMNMDTVEVDSMRMLTFIVSRGGRALWHAVHEVTIGATVPATGSGVPTVAAIALLNNVTANNTVTAGNAAVFKVNVSVPAGHSNFKISLTGDAAKGVHAVSCRVTKAGMVSYFPPELSVTSTASDGTVTIDYGVVKNVDKVDTIVELELAYKIDKTAQNASATVTAKLNDASFNVPVPGFDIVANLEPSMISVDMKDYNFLVKATSVKPLFINMETGLEFEVTVPPSAGDNDVVFEAVPDFDHTDVDLELCAVQIRNVGSGLPCLAATNTVAKQIHSKSTAARKYKDFGTVSLGSVCPVNYPGGGPDANKFTASLFFRFPGGQLSGGVIPANDVLSLSGGLSVANETIWAGSENFTLLNNFAHGTSVVKGILPSDDQVDLALPDKTYYPFITSYPILTTRGRVSEVFELGDGFFIKYIIKPRHQTKGRYKFKIFERLESDNTTAGTTYQVKLCKIAVNHIGDNLPCVNSRSITEDDDPIQVTTSEHCGATGQANFKDLNNYGRVPIVSDLTPDSDAIVITAHFQVCNNASITHNNISIHFLLETTGNSGGTEGVAYSYQSYDSIQVSNAVKLPTSGSVITQVTIDNVNTPSGTLLKGLTNIIEVKVALPIGYFGNLSIVVHNGHFDSGASVDLCGMSLVRVGDNTPCLDLAKDVVYDYKVNNKTLPDGKVKYGAMQANVSNICYVHSDHKTEARELVFEAALKLGSNITTADHGTGLLVIDVIPVTPQLKTTFPMNFTVDMANSSMLSGSAVQPYEVDLEVDPTVFNAATTAARKWIDYKVTLPVQKSVNVDFLAITPASSNRAELTVSDLGFGPGGGTNVLCVGEHVDMKETYTTNFTQTPYVKTFMQNDAGAANLGTITNSGWTIKQNRYKSPDDDQFVVRVQAQVTDHPKTVDNSSFDIFMAMRFGEDLIVVASNILTVVRPRAAGHTVYTNFTNSSGHLQATYVTDRLEEEPYMIINASHTQNGTKMGVNTTVTIQAVIYHHVPLSQAEGFPARIRVVTPKYLVFVEGVNTLQSNYTNPTPIAATMVHPAYTPHTNDTSYASGAIKWNRGYFDIEFSHGIMYSDYIGINFTLTVDHNGELNVGTGVLNTSVVMSPICTIQKFVQPSGGTYPLGGFNDYMTCGPQEVVPVMVEVQECYDNITISYECQVRGSTQISTSTTPHNAVSDPAENKVWSPAVRSGHGWRHYLDFDFLVEARITKLVMGTPTSYRPPIKVLIQVGSGPNTFEDLTEAATDQEVVFSAPVKSRYMRIVVLETHDAAGAPDAVAIGVNGIRWIGCLPVGTKPGFTISGSDCFPDNTVDSSDPSKYRHFAVDDAHGLLYYCDQNPKLDRTLCYYSNVTNGTNHWKELPRYIKSIAGYSPSKERMYFHGIGGRGVMSSRNGTTIEASAGASPDVVNAVAVPGKVRGDIGDKAWTGTLKEYKATFDGIFRGAEKLVSWSGCCGA